MRIEPIKPQPSFGYSNILKTEWLKGNLKTVKKGLYGDILTKDTVSLEHLKPASEGGKTVLSNLTLASKRMNNKRGCDDIRLHLTKEQAWEYFLQFLGVKTKRFDGDSYVKGCIKTLTELGMKL